MPITRYRPLTQTYDYYSPRKKQTKDDYYIHSCWTDEEIKQFRRNVRRQNVCVRHGFRFYSNRLEHKRLNPGCTRYLKSALKQGGKRILKDAWLPDKVTFQTKGNCLWLGSWLFHLVWGIGGWDTLALATTG